MAPMASGAAAPEAFDLDYDGGRNVAEYEVAVTVAPFEMARAYLRSDDQGATRLA